MTARDGRPLEKTFRDNLGLVQLTETDDVTPRISQVPLKTRISRGTFIWLDGVLPPGFVRDVTGGKWWGLDTSENFTEGTKKT